MTLWALQSQRWMMTHQLTCLVFSDTDVTEASTSTIMVKVTAMETTPTPTSVTISGTIPSADDSRHTEGTAGSRIMLRLEGLQLNVDQP